MKKLKISFDVDGVLMLCIEYAVQLINEKHLLDPPLSVEEFTEYNPPGERTSMAIPYYSRADFVKNQPLYDGAQELIQWVLNQGHEVFFVTAVPPQCMSVRATQLVELFPEVPATNIIMATRKELVRTDIHIDDAAHNILQSKAHYPVLFRRNWNQGTDGVLSVGNYDELKHLISQIAGNTVVKKKRGPSIICLVGPTGAGKKAIQSELKKNPFFDVPTRFSTRPDCEAEGYKYISEEEFQSLMYRGDLFEYTSYGGYWYGMTDESIYRILNKGKSVVLAVDMAGANAIKTAFPDKTTTVFIRRSKEDSISDVIERDEMSLEEKVKRLTSLEAELRNEELCDFVVLNNDTTKSAVQQILTQIGR